MSEVLVRNLDEAVVERLEADREAADFAGRVKLF